MHSLSASFVLGYHGCDSVTAEKVLNNEAFVESKNGYDWLGSGVYFWEANPDRALSWALETATRKANSGIVMTPAVVGAVIELGFCLDLITDNGITAVKKAHDDLLLVLKTIDSPIPVNSGGDDLRARNLDCAVIDYLHNSRVPTGLPKFDSVRGVFTEGKLVYPNAGFRSKTHIQVCVRERSMIKGVFRVPKTHFS